MNLRPKARRWLGHAFLGLSATLWAVLVSAQQPTSYTIVDIGTLGGQRSVALGLNNQGSVVGYSNLMDGSSHAFLFAGWSLIDLGTLGGRDSQANRISDSGVIVGRAQTSSGIYQAFMTFGGVPYDLGLVDGLLAGAYSTADAVNGQGQVAGYRQTSNEHMAPRTLIFRYGDTPLVDFSMLAEDSVVTAINNSGQSVGFYSRDPHSDYADHGGFILDGGKAVDLGSLGGRIVTPVDVNDASRVVGVAQVATGEMRAFEYFRGTMRNLGTLTGAGQSFAYGLNNSGDVVGSSDSTSGTLHAFIYNNGVMTDLNNVVPAGSGWTFTEARDINDAGQIAGTGVLDGQQRAFLLVPSRAR